MKNEYSKCFSTSIHQAVEDVLVALDVVIERLEAIYRDLGR